jgi:transcription initiation factor TFIIIB Brf1 subunit/transcription initiation factor TFIIB
MDITYAVRCKNCKKRAFSHDHTRDSLTCTNCGMVDKVEELSPDEMDDLANQLGTVQLHSQVPDVYQQMVLQYQREEAKKLQAAELEDLLAGMKVAQQKRPYQSP